MVGNDIVDLHFLDAPSYQHVRHLERVCSSEEVQAVQDSKAPSVTLAALWACKEAAYKAFSQEINCRFVPRRFAVCFEDIASLAARKTATVIFNGIPAKVHLSLTGHWIHAIATSPTAQFARYVVREIEQSCPENPRVQNESQVVRFLAAECISRFCSKDILLDFHGKRPVLMRRTGDLAKIGISFSHHGRFAAVAMAWPKADRHSEQRVRSLDTHCPRRTNALPA